MASIQETACEKCGRPDGLYDPANMKTLCINCRPHTTYIEQVNQLAARKRVQLEAVPIAPCTDIPKMLRNLADDIESGAYQPDDVTVIAIPDIFHYGRVSDEHSAAYTAFDLQWAITKLMTTAVHGEEDDQ